MAAWSFARRKRHPVMNLIATIKPTTTTAASQAGKRYSTTRLILSERFIAVSVAKPHQYSAVQS